MAQPQRNWIGHVFGDRYEIEEWIAQGGMSTVYKACDPNLRRTVAVKLIHPHLSSDPEFVQRFEQEATAVAQLRHPNIIQVYDFDHDDDVYYMVLEYVEGETLQARLKAVNAVNRRLPLAMTIQIMATVCDAVDYAHRSGMIHRDLKPANVMVNQQGQPILMDFGVAKMLGETRFTATGTVIGTALYMSPEQARGLRPDERADVYSLGVMLFEMLSGHPPFEGDSAVVILMKHVNEPVPDLRQLNLSIPNDLVAVVEKALAKNPAERYQSAAEVAAALRAADVRGSRYVPSRPSPVSVSAPSGAVSAWADSAVRPARAPLKRSWLPWLVGGTLALLVMFTLGLGLLYAAWQYASPLLLTKTESLPPADGMVKVPAGMYLVGLDAADARHAPPQHVKLSDFWIDQYEVMNTQYAQFLVDTGQTLSSHWPNGQLPAGQETYPVTGTTWDQAAAYCAWANKRLPAEAEWEVAARGPHGLPYPWGEDEHSVDLPENATYAVGSFPSNRSPFGAFDMAGNVWEWVDNPYAPVEAGHRVLRGGAFGFLKDMAYRLEGDPTVPTTVATAGLRCAADQVAGGAEQVQMPVSGLMPLAQGVLFQDSFTDPASGWPVGEQANKRFGYHPAAFYRLEVSAPNDTLSIFRGLSFGDFTTEVQALVDHTTTTDGDFRYGLAVRRTGDNYYAFTISPRTGTWQVLKSSPTGLEVLAEGSQETLRGLGAETDQLRVDAAGSDFTFHINGEIVTRVSDPDYVGGDVGFILETLDETLVHIHYASLIVRELDTRGANLVAEDRFTDPGSGWPSDDNDSRRYGYHPPDYYHLEVKIPHDRLVVSRGPDLDNVVVETQVLVDHTTTTDGDFRYGLAVRRTGDNYYAFTISPRTGTWQVLKSSPAGLEVLAEGSQETLRGLEAETDQLRVDAAGSGFTYRINGQVVTQVSDPEYARGEVGMVAETLDESLAHIHYDWLTIQGID